MSIVDSSERLRALDPLNSFCVTAPAGSGKTELLIQRYLTLLARVSKPEQVLAITFTRKAAAEMRERILQSLRDAQANAPCNGAHHLLTRQLAEAVLSASADRGWSLLGNGTRLNIKTIDAFCSSLTRQMPVLSQFGGSANVTDDSQELYREAVIDLFQLTGQVGGVSDDIKSLMLHFDNNWTKLSELFIQMLARREQWGSYVGLHHHADDAQQYLVETVQNLVNDSLHSLHAKLAPYTSELLASFNYAAAHLNDAPLSAFPAAHYTELPSWKRIRHLLLTAAKGGSWRARLDKNMGFPAGKGEAAAAKEKLKRTIESLVEVDGLLAELSSVSYLPAIEPDSKSWQLVLHLSRVLPTLSALLLLVFQRRGIVDHTQVALSAVQALGEDDQPTDLALRLDYQLQHILMDEFQDTAINQYDLVKRLTRGWGDHNNTNPGHPRSIMIVGDGMQSIYGFRNANVGLFLRAKQDGFNGVQLEPLSLSANFRSDPKIVEWVNNTFTHAFPARDDIGKSQVSYTRASAIQAGQAEACVELRGFQGDAAPVREAETICHIIQQGVADKRCQSIAVLARTRGHLQPILNQLKQLHIGYSAPDVDSLSSSPVVTDLMSLCRALHNSADTLAWISVLRAPWCGLTLDDLHRLAQTTTGAFSLLEPWAMLMSKDNANVLSDDGKSRFLLMASAMERANRTRDRLALRIWVEQLWLDLGGPAAVEHAVQLQEAERFFQLLEEGEQQGLGLDVSWLESRLNSLYIQSEDPLSKVQLMTLHKAKGLEFDWVIIPSLQKKTRSSTKPLLNWDDYTGHSGKRSFLLAANDHSKPTDSSLYNYLEIQRASKSLEETTRLLYVGTTRAVNRLYLTACMSYNEEQNEFKPPPSSSLLGRIWPQFLAQVQCDSPIVSSVANPAVSGGLQRHLRRTHLQDLPPPLKMPTGLADALDEPNMPTRSANYVDRCVGTVVHFALESFAKQGTLTAKNTVPEKQRWRLELRRLGLASAQLENAYEQVACSVATVLNDRVGRWLLSGEHEHAHSEYALNYVTESGEVKVAIIDRTFVDSTTGIRWIIDFKNSQPDSAEPQKDFLNREVVKYSDQLALYKGILAELGDHPINCALYFTALGKLELLMELSDVPTTE